MKQSTFGKKRRGSALALIVLLSALILFSWVVMPFLYGFYPGRYVGYYMWPFFFPLGFVFFLLIVFLFLRLLLFPWRRWSEKDRAEEILRERYARGEVTRDQFEQMMKDLKQHS